MTTENTQLSYLTQDELSTYGMSSVMRTSSQNLILTRLVSVVKTQMPMLKFWMVQALIMKCLFTPDPHRKVQTHAAQVAQRSRDSL